MESDLTKKADHIETNISADSNEYKVRIMAPPSAIYKADDSENVETLVTASRANHEFPSTADDASSKNKSIMYEENIPKKQTYFDPQLMLEKLRENNLYPTNTTAKEDFELLTCQSQPFLQRISIVGEIF